MISEEGPSTLLEDLQEAVERAAQLERALLSSRRIGIAIGILMERHRLTEDQAFDRLRMASQQRNTKLRDVADQLVLTGSLNG